MTRLEEFESKVARVREFLEARGYAAAALTTQANFAWLTCGGDNHVVLASENGVAYLLVTRETVHLLTNNIEAPRMVDEELGALPIEVHQQAWHEEDRERIAWELAGGPIASDSAWPAGATNESGSIARLRWQLLPPEVERYRWIGEKTAAAMWETANEIEPGMSEHGIAAALARRLLSEGIIPAVLLVATDERCYRYRHPVPTDKKLERHAMLVVGARRWGLGVSATRIVHFGPPDSELRRRHEAVCRVDACFITKTQPGTSVAEIFRAAVEEYEASGYGDQWHLHHQGGATGYAPRDYRASPNSKEVVLANQAFAWNPSIAGTKSEDTIVARPDGPELLNINDPWPMLETEYSGASVSRPDILVR
ncbi:MAG: aminopeptidase P family protein [Armatimonadetes bacterium]|nr:aminopeptidase P family protein [Armatimonadota bacterium]